MINVSMSSWPTSIWPVDCWKSLQGKWSASVQPVDQRQYDQLTKVSSWLLEVVRREMSNTSMTSWSTPVWPVGSWTLFEEKCATSVWRVVSWHLFGEKWLTSVWLVDQRQHGLSIITLTLHMVLPLFATRFADYAGGIRVSLNSHVSFNLI